MQESGESGAGAKRGSARRGEGFFSPSLRAPLASRVRLIALFPPPFERTQAINERVFTKRKNPPLFCVLLETYPLLTSSFFLKSLAKYLR